MAAGAHKTSTLSTGLLWPLRIFMGMTFLYAGIQHLTDPSFFDPSKSGYIGHLVSAYAVGSPIHDFLLGVVQPNATMFGYSVAVGESLIGIAILLGFLFRIASLAGLLLNLTFFLSATWNAFPFYFGSDIVFVACWLTLLLTGPQPWQSLDGVLARQYHALAWLVPGPIDEADMTAPTNTQTNAPPNDVRIPLARRAALYPKQVVEVNRAFDQIKNSSSRILRLRPYSNSRELS